MRRKQASGLAAPEHTGHLSFCVLALVVYVYQRLLSGLTYKYKFREDTNQIQAWMFMLVMKGQVVCKWCSKAAKTTNTFFAECVFRLVLRSTHIPQQKLVSPIILFWYLALPPPELAQFPNKQNKQYLVTFLEEQNVFLLKTLDISRIEEMRCPWQALRWLPHPSIHSWISV